MINRKTIYFLVPLLIYISCVDKRNEGFIYHAKQVSDEIKIDGCLDETVWQQTPKIVMKDNLTGEEIKDTSIQTYVWSCYDQENLYIAFECRDKDIWGTFTKRDEYLWKEEVVEIFIDTDENPDTYVEIELSPGNILFDSFIVNPVDIDFVETSKFNLSGIKTAVSINGTFNVHNDMDKKWCIEMAIPFLDLPGVKLDHLKGSQWKINFYRVDRNNGEDVIKYAWSPTHGNLHTPSKFGIYHFDKK